MAKATTAGKWPFVIIMARQSKSGADFPWVSTCCGHKLNSHAMRAVDVKVPSHILYHVLFLLLVLFLL